jgi:SAM-dependent methyltransferase
VVSGHELGRVRAALLDDAALVRAVASGRRRGAGDELRWRRVELRYVDLTAGRRLQVTSYDATQSFTANHVPAEAADAVDELLAAPFASWHVETVAETVQTRVTKKGRVLVHASPRTEAVTPDRSHDREKSRLVSTDDPLLERLGITDARGHVRAGRRGKYRQVEELVRALAAGWDDAVAAGAVRTPTTERPLRLVDLGCGNGLLTFAAHRHLTGRGLAVRTTGVDRKEQARRHNAAVAADLGWAEETEFLEADIATVGLDETPDVVLSLHACDTATDDALARAVRWGAPLVLAAPCCHHDLSAQLRGVEPPPGHSPLLRHGILRERLADTLTDALRASLLRREGYRVDVVEFVGSEHTPRNTLIRALRTGAAAPKGAQTELDALLAEWPVRPRLLELLEAPR